MNNLNPATKCVKKFIDNVIETNKKNWFDLSIKCSNKSLANDLQPLLLAFEDKEQASVALVNQFDFETLNN